MTGYESKRAMAQDKLAQPAQKPVSWAVVGDGKFGKYELGQVFVDYEATHIYWKNRGYELVPVYTAPSQRKPLTPDMFWNQDDAETPYDSIEEFLNHEICNGYLEMGAEFTLLRAKKFPSVKIKVTSIDWNECEAEYEIIEAADSIKE